MRVVMGLVIILSLCACALENKPYRRAERNLFDPVCAPDGSTVRIEYTNSKGDYNGIKTSFESCPWYKK